MPPFLRSPFCRRSVLALALAVGCAGLVRAEETAIVGGTMPEDFLPSLRPILAGAVAQSPTALQGQIDLAIAEANKYASMAIYWPQLSGNGGYGRSSANTTGQVGSTSSSGLTYGVNVNRDLFEWGADKASVDLNKLNAKISARNFGEAYRTLVVTIRSQYLGLIEKKILLRNARFDLGLTKKQLDSVREKAKNGMISVNVVGPLELSYKEQALNYDRVETDYNFAKGVFVRLCGLTELSDESIPSAVGRPLFHSDLAEALLQRFVNGGVESTFQDDVLRMEVEEQKLNYRIVKYGLFPKAGFGASYNVSNSTQVSAGVASISRVNSTFVGLNVGWTIFDGFRTHYAKQVSLAQRRSYERQKKNYEDTAIDTATNMKALCGFADRAMDIAFTRRDLGQNGVNQISEQVKLGSVSQDVLDTQSTNLNAADYGATIALCEYLNRWTEFVSTVGQDPALKNLPPVYVR